MHFKLYLLHELSLMSNLSMSFNILFLWIQQIKTNLHETFKVLEIMFISYQPMQPFKYLFTQDILSIGLDINYTYMCSSHTLSE